MVSLAMFIPPMLCSRLTDFSRLDDPRYLAEPKLDGQHTLALEVLVNAGRDELVRWGDWGWAARLTLTYRLPHRDAITIDEIVRVQHPQSFEIRRGHRAEVLCWGVLASGRLRLPVFLRWLTDGAMSQGDASADPARPSTRPEVVLLIGLPASGKSTFFRARLAATHEHVSKDLLGHRRGVTRTLRERVEASLRRGASVAIDNTNATVEERARWLALGRVRGARLVGYYLDAQVRDCVARNRARPSPERVPDAAIYVTAAKFKKPSMTEGFDDLRRVRVLSAGDFAVERIEPTPESSPDPA